MKLGLIVLIYFAMINVVLQQSIRPGCYSIPCRSKWYYNAGKYDWKSHITVNFSILIVLPQHIFFVYHILYLRFNNFPNIWISAINRLKNLGKTYVKPW